MELVVGIPAFFRRSRDVAAWALNCSAEDPGSIHEDTILFCLTSQQAVVVNGICYMKTGILVLFN